MSERNLLQNVEFRHGRNNAASGSAHDLNTAIIDMADYESVVFSVCLLASVATGVATLKAEMNDANSDTGMAAIPGASVSLTCVVDNDITYKWLVLEVRNPAKRYVQGVLTSAVANISYGPTQTMLIPRRKPAVQGSAIASKLLA